MTHGRLLWRCRLCGDVIPGESVADAERHLAELLDGPKSARMGTHWCRHGAIGWTDIAGALPDKETPP